MGSNQGKENAKYTFVCRKVPLRIYAEHNSINRKGTFRNVT